MLVSGALRLSVAKIAISGHFGKWCVCVVCRGCVSVCGGVLGLGMLKGLIYRINHLKINALIFGRVRKKL